MAVCILGNNLTKDSSCGYSLPQVVEIYLANFSQVTGTTLSADKQVVESITMSASSKWYKIEPSQNSATWSDTLGVGANGNKYRIHTIGFSFSGKYDEEVTDALDALSLGKYVAVARMADGTYLMLGRLAGLEADADGANNTGSGDATAEAGITVNLTGNTTEAALVLSDAAIKTVTGVTD